MKSQFPDDEARTKNEMLDNFLQQVIKFNTVLQEQIADLKNRLSVALTRVKKLEATMIDAIEAPEEAELKDEIRRRDEIIESNKTLASDLIDALSRVDAGVFCINNLDFQLAASNKRVGELEAALAVYEELVLPCDIFLPPATRIIAGCKLSGVVAGLQARIRYADKLLKEVKP